MSEPALKEEPEETSSPSSEEGEEEEVSPGEEEKPEKDERVVPKGNPLRKKRGGIVAGVAGFLAFALMAHNGQLRWGVPLGLMCCAVAAWGLMDVLGTFDDGSENVVRKLGLAHLVGPLFSVLASGLLTCSALMGGQSG